MASYATLKLKASQTAFQAKSMPEADKAASHAMPMTEADEMASHVTPKPNEGFSFMVTLAPVLVLLVHVYAPCFDLGGFVCISL